MTDLQPLVDRLHGEEGVRLQVYDDATGLPIKPGTLVKGNPTLGIGTEVGPGAGITEAEAEFLLRNRLLKAAADASTLPSWAALNEARRLVLIDMVFNMGAKGVRTFGGMLAAIIAGDYAAAAEQMLASLWARQTGHRAANLAEIMRTGVWQ